MCVLGGFGVDAVLGRGPRGWTCTARTGRALLAWWCALGQRLSSLCDLCPLHGERVGETSRYGTVAVRMFSGVSRETVLALSLPQEYTVFSCKV